MASTAARQDVQDGEVRVGLDGVADERVDAFQSSMEVG
jgi:hypothetical protein